MIWPQTHSGDSNTSIRSYWSTEHDVITPFHTYSTFYSHLHSESLIGDSGHYVRLYKAWDLTSEPLRRLNYLHKIIFKHWTWWCNTISHLVHDLFTPIHSESRIGDSGPLFDGISGYAKPEIWPQTHSGDSTTSIRAYSNTEHDVSHRRHVHTCPESSCQELGRWGAAHCCFIPPQSAVIILDDISRSSKGLGWY